MGAIALIDLESVLEDLRIIATEAIHSDLQKASRSAAYPEEKRLAEEQGRNPIKPPKPERLVYPREKNEPRVIWDSPTDLFVSEGFVGYGASQEAISEGRNLSVGEVRRHLGNVTVWFHLQSANAGPTCRSIIENSFISDRNTD